jgi:hypothetical protein
MPKLTSGIAGEPTGSTNTTDKLPLLPKPMNCPQQCETWKANLLLRDPEKVGCEHSMSTQELKEWLGLLRPSRIAMNAEAGGRRKKGVDDEISI